MIDVGTTAATFELKDQFGRMQALSQHLGPKHVMLVFYPLDFTPTWSKEIPALEALQSRFEAAHTAVLGISIDSVYCHANWAASFGGVSFPLLSDFHPKGAVAASFGLYLDQAGITDRATVIIDAGGTVRHISSVGPGGERDISELAALCEGVDAAWQGDLPDAEHGPGLEPDTTLYVRDNCMFSVNALAARTNLHLEDALPVANVSQDAAARARLEKLSGRTTAPALVIGDTVMFEAADIMTYLAKRITGY